MPKFPTPRLLLFLALLCLSTLTACNRDEDRCNDCVLLSYAQTQCADPWGYGVDGSDVAVTYAVRDFFASNGIGISTVSVQGATTPVTNCAACTCPTGKTIFALVNSADAAAFRTHGFY